jgi:cysteine sulfinate desulfinase/cysteine desulfurase-like protein
MANAESIQAQMCLWLRHDRAILISKTGACDEPEESQSMHVLSDLGRTVGVPHLQ